MTSMGSILKKKLIKKLTLNKNQKCYKLFYYKTKVLIEFIYEYNLHKKLL